MNIKNSFINCKSQIVIIVCSLICVICIRHLSSLNTVPYNQSRKITLTDHKSIISLSNKPSPSTSLEKNDSQEIAIIGGYVEEIKKNRSTSNAANEIPVVNAHLSAYLMYKDVNIRNLKDFLESKNSLLAQEPYFSTILSVSKDFNVNPLVMFAITGQEQSFVPKSNDNAYKIANNPFNVFNSWKKYNTNIEDTTTIAARTLVNLSKNKPDNIDGLTWINRKYSEDQNWSKAVRSIFKQIEGNVSYLK
ncbi:MAG: hypothetical protein N2B06_08160 [Clostridium sp.]